MLRYEIEMTEEQYDRFMRHRHDVWNWFRNQGCSRYVDWDFCAATYTSYGTGNAPITIYFKDDQMRSAFILRWMTE